MLHFNPYHFYCHLVILHALILGTIIEVTLSKVKNQTMPSVLTETTTYRSYTIFIDFRLFIFTAFNKPENRFF